MRINVTHVIGVEYYSLVKCKVTFIIYEYIVHI